MRSMPTRQPDLSDDIRAVYQGPLDGFIAARNALAKRLRTEKDPREAEVKALAKPGLSAWAVNRLFALEPRAMAAFVGAGERARAAQRKAAAGGDAKALRESINAVREQMAMLLPRAVAALSEGERAPGDAIVERVKANLEALAWSADAGPIATRGWLDDDLPPPGFEVMAALQVAAAGTRPALAAVPAKPATVHRLDERRGAVAAKKEKEAEERRQRERHEAISRLRAELQRADADARAERRAAEQASRDADEAERRATSARAQAKAAAERAQRAEAALAKAKAALQEAERD
jgi:hypothetical protein